MGFAGCEILQRFERPPWPLAVPGPTVSQLRSVEQLLFQRGIDQDAHHCQALGLLVGEIVARLYVIRM